mgnify:CR=1 FL=1
MVATGNMLGACTPPGTSLVLAYNSCQAQTHLRLVTRCSDKRWAAVLCCAVLCCAVLCCAVLVCRLCLQLQWPYDDWLAQAAGVDVQQLPTWRPAMYAANRQNKLSHPEDYRDRCAVLCCAVMWCAEACTFRMLCCLLHPAFILADNIFVAWSTPV